MTTPEKLKRTIRALEDRQRRKLLVQLGVVPFIKATPVATDSRKLNPIPISARDAELMHWLKDVLAAPADVLATRFFARNLQSGSLNKNPLSAATKRLNELASAGYLLATSIAPSPSHEPGGRVYSNGKATARSVGGELVSPGPKQMHGHLQTLRSVELVRQRLVVEGRRQVGLELRRGELLVREAQAGNPVPSAVVVVDDGRTIAVQYLSTDFTAARAQKQAAYFTERYDEVCWTANSAATKARLLRTVSGASCEVLPAAP